MDEEVPTQKVDLDEKNKKERPITKKTKSKRNANCDVKCEVCQVNFGDLFSLENHVNQGNAGRHTAEEQSVKCNELSCSNCRFKFGAFDNLRRHVINSVCHDLDRFHARLKSADNAYNMIE